MTSHRVRLVAVLPLFAVALAPSTAGMEARRIASSPVITAVSPESPRASATAQMLTVTGRDLLDGLRLEVLSPDGVVSTYSGGSVLERRDTRFRVSMVLDRAGKYALKVVNLDGGTSEPFVVTVRVADPEAPAAPRIDRIRPPEPVHDQHPQTLIVEGDGFQPGLKAVVTNPIGQPIPDAAVSRLTGTSFQLQVRLDQAGRYEIVAINPSGDSSNVAVFSVR